MTSPDAIHFVQAALHLEPVRPPAEEVAVAARLVDALAATGRPLRSPPELAALGGRSTVAARRVRGLVVPLEPRRDQERRLELWISNNGRDATTSTLGLSAVVERDAAVVEVFAALVAAVESTAIAIDAALGYGGGAHAVIPDYLFSRRKQLPSALAPWTYIGPSRLTASTREWSATLPLDRSAAAGDGWALQVRDPFAAPTEALTAALAAAPSPPGGISWRGP